MDDNTISIRFTADTANLVEGTRVVRRSLDDIGSGAAGAQSPVERLQQSVGNYSRQAREAETASGRLKASMSELKSIAGGLVAGFSLGVVIKESIEAALAMDRLNKLFTAAAGSSNLAGREMEYIRNVSNRLGLDLLSTAESYGKFMASIRGTSLEGEKGRKVFEAVSAASTALGMRADETSGVFNALQQMMSKGKVQAEELRGQLGERLPGAFKMAADAMGVSTAELDKMLAQGTVAADVLLPRLAEQLQKTYGGAALEGANSAQAAINRMNNAMLDTKATLGAALIPAFTDFLGILKPVLEGIQSFIGGLQIMSIKSAAFFDSIALKGKTLFSKGWLGFLGNDYKAGMADIDSNKESAISDLMKRYTPTGADYTAAEKMRQAMNKPSAIASKSGKGGGDEYNSFAEAYNRMIDAIAEGDPTITAEQKAVQKLTDQYENLYISFPKHRAELEALYSDHLRQVTALQAMKQAVNATSVEFQGLLQEWENTPPEHNALGAFNLTNDDTLKLIDSLNGLDKLKEFENNLKNMVGALDEAATVAPDKVEAITTAIEQLKSSYADSSGLTEILKNNADLKIDLIDDQFQRQQAALDKEYGAKKKHYEDELKLASTTADKKAAIEEALALEKQKYDADSSKNSKAAFKSQLSSVANYAGTAANLFSELANAQDQSSREGFEAAKKYSIAAAIMNTAAAVMNALATSNNIYVGMAMAALAAATGAMQIAKIQSTTYGGGGSVSAPSGSFGGGSTPAAQSSVGNLIGTQYTSIAESKTQDQLQKIANSMGNASLALGKVADGLTKIADLFTSGSILSLASGASPNQQVSLTSESGISFTKWLGSAINPIGQFLKAIQSGNVTSGWSMFDPVSAWIAKSIFGGSWQTTGAGVQLGLSGNTVSARNYVTKHKDGGWFSSDKNRTDYSPTDANFVATIQTTVNQIISQIGRAAIVMGTRALTDTAALPATNIATAGRSADDIAKALQTWLESASNALAKTVVGLQQYTFYNENAFDALVRLSTALQTVNEGLELINGNLIYSSLSGANAAYKLQELMGGSEKFTDAISTYFTAMYSDEEQSALKAAQASRQVSVAFAEMGIAVPPTKAAFRELVSSLNLSTESGAATFAALMNIAEAFGTVQDQAAELQKSMMDLLNDAFTSAAAAAAKALSQAEATLKNTLSTAQSATSILIGLQSGTTGSPESQYLALKQAFSDAVAGNDKATMLRIANDFAAASKTYNATGAAYVSDIATITAALEPLTGADQTDMSLTELQQHSTYLQQIEAELSGSGSLNTSIAGLRADLAAYNNARELAKAGAQAAYDRKVSDASSAISALTGAQSVNQLATTISNMANGSAANPFGFTSTMATLANNVLSGTGSAADLQAVINTQISRYFADALTNLQSYGVNPTVPGVTVPTTLKTEAELAAEATARTAASDAKMTQQASEKYTIYSPTGGVYDFAGWVTGYVGKMVNGALPYNAKYDIAPNGGDGRLTMDDYEAWYNIETGKRTYSSYTSKPAFDVRPYPALLNYLSTDFAIPPGYAAGTAYVPNDMLANIHQGEIIMDRRSSDILRHYGIPTYGSADNKALLEEIRALREEVAALKAHAEASVRVQQAGLSAIADNTGATANSMATVERKARLAAAA